MEGEFLIRLVSTSEGSIIYLASIKNGIAIDELPTGKDKAIKEVGDNSNKVDNVGIVNTNKIAKFKDLIKAKAGFFTFGIRLVFTKLRQVFTKVFIFYYFDLEYHI